MVVSFNQPPPRLGNQYDEDRVLRSYLRRVLPPDVLKDVEPSLREMGELAGGMLYEMSLAHRLDEPRLTQWDAWGERIDRLEQTPVWDLAERLAAEKGVVATAYEGRHGSLSRIHQFALAYLFGPSTDTYACPLAMTDGAARTLLDLENQALIDRAVPHLTSRDPAQFWTSGQWMTESTGGSDVGLTETVARQDGSGTWRLSGRKWFTSAAASQMALTLARPEGNPEGGHGLAVFYLETRDEMGRLRNIRVNRLKDKLGTRALPTAELMLHDTPAELVAGTTGGVRNIAPMLNITRTWNSVIAASGMRRGVALARDYARRRHAFGSTLAEKPLHLDTLAALQAEQEASFHLSFRLVELLGKREHREIGDDELALLRLLTPVVKLTTGKQAVAVSSEVLECFGGAGYVEDTGLPRLLRDAQVLPIWEGTTNVLSLDTLRALAREGGLDQLESEVKRLTRVRDHRLAEAGQVGREAIAHAREWLHQAMREGQEAVEAGARRFALTLGRSLALGLLVSHAQWSLDHEQDRRAHAAALRFADSGADFVAYMDPHASWMLANDEPAPPAVGERRSAE
ncbi:MAG: acyl-CoA dehydrogenase family protein [Myxococcota bacterium]